MKEFINENLHVLSFHFLMFPGLYLTFGHKVAGVFLMVSAVVQLVAPLKK